MAKKKRKKRAQGRNATVGHSETQVPASSRAETNGRRERKAEAREARERARKRLRRTQALRRAAYTTAVAVVVVAVFLFLTRIGGSRPIPAEAVQAAKTAGCTGVQSPAGDTSGGQHLQSGQSYNYMMHPALFGFHDPSPLPDSPHVYTTAVPETRAVHNLEHSYVLIYYRQSGDGALPQPVIAALTSVANSSKHVIMAPYPNLPAGQALALAAWDKIQQCPASVTATQARTVASGFIHAFVCTNNSPENFGC